MRLSEIEKMWRGPFGWTKRFVQPLVSFAKDSAGSYAVYSAVAALPLFTGAALAIEYADASRLRSELQQVLDASVLAGARENSGQVKAAENFFAAYFNEQASPSGPMIVSFELGDGVLNATASRPMEMTFGMGLVTDNHRVGVKSQAKFLTPHNPPCITLLANTSQALLLNSGAEITAPGCEVHIHSQKQNALLSNSGTRLDMARACVRSTNNIERGYIRKIETNCDVAPDPYAGKIPEPVVPSKCTTSGPVDGQKVSIKPGLHCNVNFNGSPTVTFEPGLHIIRGHMNINSGANVIAEGVTFYFPDTNSKVQFNGGLKIKATAPEAGTYSGILFFEKTSDAANNASKSQFVFNGSLGETLEGVIYLPNRDLTYNSKTNIQNSRLSIVANTMIVNQANWKFDSYMSGGASGEKIVYLSR